MQDTVKISYVYFVRGRQMEIVIQKGTLQYLNDCEEILLNSQLGRKYFTGEDTGKKAILEGIEQENLYVALIENVCAGFFYYIPKGCFHSFPYLHLIAVKEEYRGRGIGRKLIDFLEEVVCADSGKIFLVVADFNPEAKHFYEKNGYRQVGELPDLYKKGITEYLMMKEKRFRDKHT